MIDRAMAFIERWEGGYADHPDDPGGATKYGISQRAFPSLDIRNLSRDAARDIYRDHYWSPARCYDLPAPLALIHFDCAVNQGLARSARILQQAVGATVDGRIGPRTLSAVDAAWSSNPRKVLGEYAVQRALHYAGLRAFKTFGRGWLRRLFAAHAEALEML